MLTYLVGIVLRKNSGWATDRENITAVIDHLRVLPFVLPSRGGSTMSVGTESS